MKGGASPPAAAILDAGKLTAAARVATTEPTEKKESEERSLEARKRFEKLKKSICLPPPPCTAVGLEETRRKFERHGEQQQQRI